MLSCFHVDTGAVKIGKEDGVIIPKVVISNLLGGHD